MSRKQVREQVFKLIYEYIINLERNDFFLEEIKNEFSAESKYITDVYEGVVANYDSLVAEVEKYILSFSIDRIFKVDLAILLLAVYEIKYLSDIPSNVSINEAVNLAKTYSTEKSSAYINGVLANFVK